MSMPHQFICRYLNSSPIACQHNLLYANDCYVYDLLFVYPRVWPHRTCGLVVRALAICLVGRCSHSLNLSQVMPRPKKRNLLQSGQALSIMTAAGKLSNANAIFYSLSESGRVAICLPIGTTLKTKCVRLKNGRSLQHPKQTSAWAIIDATRRTILMLCSYIVCLAIALYKHKRNCALYKRNCAKATAWAMHMYVPSGLTL